MAEKLDNIYMKLFERGEALTEKELAYVEKAKAKAERDASLCSQIQTVQEYLGLKKG